ncbi:hypothetical protein HNR06_000312 [Nocardiopsis arvandica]|uniref:DUF423 domain-containing protein n=1 Tax=Nocardiopsis sinuspersici TaxID=501010 RepID=A0A7Y9X826_9ACTN|nr:hypothetical protein [Nocardiopsis sinuspersici]NYH50723.1 hypothetical protein [Nocardiopsis sinuspersici]
MDRATTNPATAGPLRLLRAAVLLHLAAILWEGATAGQLVTLNMDALPLHYYGAFGVHALAGSQALAAALYWQRSGRGGGIPRTVLLVSLAAFALGFAQAALGTYGPLQAHVPLALFLTGIAAWSAVLAWRGR